jgi:diguanylate cyclase (GGDEF)-like protein
MMRQSVAGIAAAMARWPRSPWARSATVAATIPPIRAITLVKPKTAPPDEESAEPRRPHPLPFAAAASQPRPSEPKPLEPRPRATAVRLAAEVERLATELAATRDRLRELEARIDIDPLTDTLNRRGFEREFKRAFAHAKRYGMNASLIYLDLDAFKPVNDRHGHAAGDAMLRAIAATLMRHVRASDVVARIGGDEFAVLLFNLSGAAALAKADELEAAICATAVRFGGATLAVGASAGVAAVEAVDTAAAVLSRADAAMYARKAQRKRVQEKWVPVFRPDARQNKR